MVNSSTQSRETRLLSEATLERLTYEHSPSVEERNSQARLAARRRMSERHGVTVELVEEQPAVPAASSSVEDTVQTATATGEREEAVRNARRARRAARKAQKEAEREVEAARQLETTARRMFYGGFFALPQLWLVSLIYFHQEHKSPDANPKIKRWYKITIIMFTIYSVIFLAWLITFQLGAETRFRNINIIHAKVRSPSNM